MSSAEQQIGAQPEFINTSQKKSSEVAVKLTNIVQDKHIRAAFLAHYSIEGWEKPLAVTLTLKPKGAG